MQFFSYSLLNEHFLKGFCQNCVARRHACLVGCQAVHLCLSLRHTPEHMSALIPDVRTSVLCNIAHFALYVLKPS